MTKNESPRMGVTPEKAMELYPENNDSKLKQYRVSRGYSQGGLSEASGVTKRAIQCYEQRERNIDKASLYILCDLAESLNCKIEDILEDEELKEKYKRVK